MSSPTNSISPHDARVRIIDLFRAGFSTQEILHLRAMREEYPQRAHLTRAELARLATLQRRVEHERSSDSA